MLYNLRTCRVLAPPAQARAATVSTQWIRS